MPIEAIIDPIARWHREVEARFAGLEDLLADDVVFQSPAVHTRRRAGRSPPGICAPP